MNKVACKNRIILSLFFIAVFFLVCIHAAPQEQKDQQKEKPVHVGLTEKLEVNLVLLEAIAHDKKGNHIRGLKKEDFRVLEEGKEQTIAVFEEVDLVRKESYQEALEKELAAPPKEIAEAKKLPEQRKGRTLLFLFDICNSPSALFLSQAKKAVADFMENRFNPGDVAAVFEITPDLSMVCNFTSDPGEVKGSLDKIRFFPKRSVGDELLDEAANFRVAYKEDFTRRIAYAAALRNQILRQERQNFYYNLGSLAFTLSELSGKKMIVLFSGGFPMTVPGDPNDEFGGITPAFRDLIANMAKHNVSIYTFDIAEMTAMLDASEKIDYRIPLGKLGFGEDFFEDIGIGSSFWANSAEARRQILAVLGNETGGAFMINPDYKAGLASLDDDTNHYYLLGYYPAEKVEKEKYRKIKIKVAKENVTIISRKGRFALKEEPRKASAAPESALHDVKKMQQEAKKPDEKAIPCEVAVSFSPLKNGQTRVTFALQVLDKVEPFVNEQGNGIVDLTLKIYANAGQITVDSKQKDIKAILKPEGVQALSDGFRIVEFMDLVPAVYDFQLSLRLNGMGKYLSWSKTFEVQGFKEPMLSLSTFSLVLEQRAPLLNNSYTESGGSEADQSRSICNPFELKNGLRIVPAATRSFRQGENILLYYKVMNARRDETTGKPDLDMNFELVPLEGSKEIPAVSKIQPSLLYFGPSKEGEEFDAIIEIRITDYKPGSYLLKTGVRDKKSGIASLREERVQLL